MGQDSAIQWTTHTANPWWGCKEISIGCDRCYARVFAKRVGKGDAWEGMRYATKGIWKDLAKWQASAAAAGEVHRVFTGSMMDIFEKCLPVSTWQGEATELTTDCLRARYFNDVVPATPDLLHLLLTKRPGNIAGMVPPSWLRDWPANVMTGTSVVDQATADVLIPQLLRVPGPHFLSMEPMLGPVDLTKDETIFFCNACGRLSGGVNGGDCSYCGDVRTRERCYLDYLDWIICGGESGPNARPFNLAWARSIRDQCKAAGVPFFMKQVGHDPFVIDDLSHHPVLNRDRLGITHSHGGDWDEWPEDLRVREFPAPAGAPS